MEKEFKSVDDKQIVKEQLPGESYSEYDQADFYYNLGATQATKLETLDNPDFQFKIFMLKLLEVN